MNFHILLGIILGSLQKNYKKKSNQFTFQKKKYELSNVQSNKCIKCPILKHNDRIF